MPDRSRKKKKPGPKDLNELARRIVDQATGEEQPEEEPEDTSGKNPAAVALGRLGGKKGGPARAKKLNKKTLLLQQSAPVLFITIIKSSFLDTRMLRNSRAIRIV